jgi:GT2 family glycosyltransferase
MNATAVAALAPCGIRHVDLDAPLSAVEAAAGEKGVFVIFWKADAPVATLLLVREELPVVPSAIPALAAEAAASQWGTVDRADRTPPQGVLTRSISVVVCTRNRPDDLRTCLTALAACDPPPGEVIIVDNAPDGRATRDAVAAFPFCTYIAEPLKGLSNARNAGVRASRGDIIAFTDDDVVVPPDWIARLASAFADESVGCVTGYVVPADLATGAACVFEVGFGGFGCTMQRRRFEKPFLRGRFINPPEVWKIGAGANMAVRRSALARVGLFDPRLGAGATGCSEDSEFWFRLLNAGIACQYEPRIHVTHRHRHDAGALKRQLRAYARGHAMALFIQFLQDRNPKVFARYFYVLPKFFARSTLSSLRIGDWLGLSLTWQRILGHIEAPFLALAWLPRKGPPPLSQHGDQA